MIGESSPIKKIKDTIEKVAPTEARVLITGENGVGTALESRGRGLAELVTRVATNIGFDCGAPYITLQATSMGEPVYRKLGYRELYRFANFTRFA